MPAAHGLPKTIGRYDVVRQIGAGAMGRVLLARDPVLDRDVAIKVLRDDLRIPADVRDGLLVRMRHEARAAARVTHPNLVTLHDMGEDDSLGLYLVFEYLEGPTLKERIAERRLSAGHASRLARELGGALTFAHEKGVLHRDVKPDNIILTATGSKIADFGIARVPDSTLTHSGGLLGTPAYSAPETFHDSRFSPASDQFSLASTLYEAISGVRAFPGDDAVAVAAKIANEEPKPFAERLGYAASLDTVLGRAMSKHAVDRYESCDEFGRALVVALIGGAGADDRSARAGDRTSGVPASNKGDRSRERHPWQAIIGGLGVVIVVALLVRAFLKNRDTAAAEAPSSTTTTAVESTAVESTASADKHPHPPPRVRPSVDGVNVSGPKSAAPTPSLIAPGSASSVVVVPPAPSGS